MGPLLTSDVCERLLDARRTGATVVDCSLDLGRSITSVHAGPEWWTWSGCRYGYPEQCRERTIYHWTGHGFEPVARYGSSLIKLVPTEWGPPTFEIDGIKMLVTARVSPYADAERKVKLIQPRGKVVLDTCGGLGYFAAWCLREKAAAVMSYEKNADVIWLRSLNPWSPPVGDGLMLTQADVTEAILRLPGSSVDAVLHDPPRFGIAGELYSQKFYDQLARVLRRNGRLFHYTGAPNQRSAGRDLKNEVTRRLRNSGFDVAAEGDGVLGVKTGRGQGVYGS